MHNKNCSKTMANGQWNIILTRLGVDSSSLDGKHHPCPSCGGKDRFRFDNKGGDGTYICNQCGAGDGFSLIKKLFNCSFKDAAFKADETMSCVDIAPARIEVMKEQQAAQGREAEVAKAFAKAWKGYDIAEDHTYLKAKGVKAYGLRIHNDKLVIPIKINRNISSLQFINSHGSKMFGKGGCTSGGFHGITGDEEGVLAQIIICEGYATGASVREATGSHVAVAFTAGNLYKVALAIRKKRSDITIIIAADNDQKTAFNPGVVEATKAANAVAGLVAIPRGKKGCNIDWNDVHKEQGLAAVKAGIKRAVTPSEDSAEYPLCDFGKVVKGQKEALPSLPTPPSAPFVNSKEWGNPEPLPSSLLPIPAFNPHLLPDVFKDYVLDVVERTCCPIEFVAVSIMTALGGVVGKKCSIHPKANDDWLVVPNLWGALVGRPSTMKSPSISAGTAGVDMLVKRAEAAYANDCEKAEISKLVYEAEVRELKRRVAEAVRNKKPIPTHPVDKPTIPIETRYITNAGSVEKLIKLLSENENGIIQLRDELMGWMKSMDVINSEDARSFYLEAWNGTGSSFSYDTMTHGHLCLNTGPCVSVLGGIQPSKLAGLVYSSEHGQAGDDGMLQRFQLLVYPDNMDSFEYRDRKPNQQLAQSMKNIFASAINVSGKARFAEGAQVIFVDWYTNLMKRMPAEEHAGVEAHLSKYPQLMPALALLIHIANNGDKALTSVSKEAALKAVDWCSFLESHARRIYGMSDLVGVDAARKIIDRVIDGRLSNPFKLGSLYKLNITGAKTSEQARKILELLEAYGWARVEQTSTGGRPSTICTIHPRACFFSKHPPDPLVKVGKGSK